MKNGRILLNIQEVCDYLGIGKTKARELLRGYNGFGVQIGNRWYANKKKLDEWIDNETMQLKQHKGRKYCGYCGYTDLSVEKTTRG